MRASDLRRAPGIQDSSPHLRWEEVRCWRCGAVVELRLRTALAVAAAAALLGATLGIALLS
jgi:hypothetical protein